MKKHFDEVPLLHSSEKGGEVKGVYFYVLGKPGEVIRTFPTELWHESLKVDTLLNQGDGWELRRFAVLINSWPSPFEWEEQVYETCSALLGKSIAVWIGDEYLGCSFPPFCFDDPSNEDSAYVFLSKDKWFFNAFLDRVYEKAPMEVFRYTQEYLNQKLGLKEVSNLKNLLNDLSISVKEIKVAITVKNNIKLFASKNYLNGGIDYLKILLPSALVERLEEENSNFISELSKNRRAAKDGSVLFVEDIVSYEKIEKIVCKIDALLSDIANSLGGYNSL